MASIAVATRFFDMLSDVQGKAEQIQELYGEIDSESKSEKEYLDKLKSAPRNAKAANRELKKKLNVLRKSHVKYVGKAFGFSYNLGKWTLILFMTVCGLFFWVMLFFCLWYYAVYEAKVDLPTPVGNYLLAINDDYTGLFDIRQMFNEDGYDQSKLDTYLARYGPSKTVVVTEAVWVVTSLLLGFISWRGVETNNLKKIIDGLEIPLYTPNNKERQKKLDGIARDLKHILPRLIRDGNMLLNQEAREGQISDDMLYKMSEIEKLDDAARRLTLKGHLKALIALRASHRTSFDAGSAGSALAIIGVALIACVGIAAAIAGSAVSQVATYED
jgi:hypothetical protein